jgi:hypothetical protein
LSGIAALLKASPAKTAVAKAAKVGTTGLYEYSITDASYSIAKTFATNTATEAATASWLTKLAQAAGKTIKGGSILAIIGSYPYAGFIKEEALQTLGYGTTTALANNDLEGAEAAIQHQHELLDPGIWESIKASVPFVNVVDKLESFYEAARVKLAIDEKRFEHMKQAQAQSGSEEGSSPAAIARQEEENDYQANIDYYNEQRKQLVEWEQAARKAEREEEAAFWLDYQEKIRAAEEADRKAIADFWLAYRKRQQEINEANSPSKLNFGII